MNLIIKINNRQKIIKQRIWGKKYCLKPGVNLLFGGNGAGKTSLISLLRYKANPSWNNPEKHSWHRFESGEKGNVNLEKDINLFLEDSKEEFKGVLYYYSNSNNNAMRKNSDEFDFNMYDCARRYQGSRWSEGMNVSVAGYDFIYAIEHGFEKEGLILIDEIDSGLDAIACSLIINKLFNAIKGKEEKYYILITFNQYEIAKTVYENGVSEWINCYSGKRELIPSSYDKYYKKLYQDKSTHRRLGDEGAWGMDEDDWYDVDNGMTNKELRELNERKEK